MTSQSMPFDHPDNPLAIEIKQEMAASYFGACRKMVDSLEALKAFDRDAVSAAPDANHMARRSELLEEAVKRVYFVIIQREAMRLPCYDQFFETYEVPEEVAARLGPKRRR